MDKNTFYVIVWSAQSAQPHTHNKTMIIIGKLYTGKISKNPVSLFVREFWEFKAHAESHPENFMSGERQLCKILKEKKFTVPVSDGEEPDIILEFPSEEVTSHLDWCEERQAMTLDLQAQIDATDPDFFDLLVASKWTPVNHDHVYELYGLTLPRLITVT